MQTLCGSKESCDTAVARPLTVGTEAVQAKNETAKALHSVSWMLIALRALQAIHYVTCQRSPQRERPAASPDGLFVDVVFFLHLALDLLRR